MHGETLIIFVNHTLTVASSENRDIYNFGPANIKRLEGERNVFIPCPFGDGEYQVIWEINDITYANYDLPEWCAPYALGLVIRRIERRLNLTSFRCLYLGSETQVSSTGVLTVIPSTL